MFLFSEAKKIAGRLCRQRLATAQPASRSKNATYAPVKTKQTNQQRNRQDKKGTIQDKENEFFLE